MSRVVAVYHLNGEYEQFNNVEVEANCSYTTLESLEKDVMTIGKGFESYLNILKSACAICRDEYGDTIDDIIDDVYLITVEYHVNDRTFTNFFIDTGIIYGNTLDKILDAIQEFIKNEVITIFEGRIDGINWRNGKASIK